MNEAYQVMGAGREQGGSASLIPHPSAGIVFFIAFGVSVMMLRVAVAMRAQTIFRQVGSDYCTHKHCHPGEIHPEQEGRQNGERPVNQRVSRKERKVDTQRPLDQLKQRRGNE